MFDWLRGWWKNSEPLGRRGERAAARFLRKLGYKVIALDHRTRFGEIDVIAVDGRTVVFVEVKTRASAELGSPFEAIDRAKQRRMTRAAVGYLRRHGLLSCRARFDAVAVIWPPGVRRPRIEHIPNAFEAVGWDSMYS